jgi:hypothetical protein
MEQLANLNVPVIPAKNIEWVISMIAFDHDNKTYV